MYLPWVLTNLYRPDWRSRFVSPFFSGSKHRKWNGFLYRKSADTGLSLEQKDLKLSQINQEIPSHVCTGIPTSVNQNTCRNCASKFVLLLPFSCQKRLLCIVGVAREVTCQAADSAADFSRETITKYLLKGV